MFEFNVKTFIENLCEIPKVKAPRKRRTKGFNYLIESVCIPVLHDSDVSIDIDFERFTMKELDNVIRYFHKEVYERIEKLNGIYDWYAKCSPAACNTAFL